MYSTLSGLFSSEDGDVMNARRALYGWPCAPPFSRSSIMKSMQTIVHASFITGLVQLIFSFLFSFYFLFLVVVLEIESRASQHETSTFPQSYIPFTLILAIKNHIYSIFLLLRTQLVITDKSENSRLPCYYFKLIINVGIPGLIALWKLFFSTQIELRVTFVEHNCSSICSNNAHRFENTLCYATSDI